MRLAGGIAIASALLALPLGAEEIEIKADFAKPAISEKYLGNRPIWSQIRLRNARHYGSGEGLVSGDLSMTWELNVDPGGFYLGDAPVLADINGDGRPDLVTIQFLPENDWRLLVIDLPMSGTGYMTEIPFAGMIEEAVLLGVADFDDDGVAEVAVTLKGVMEGRAALVIARWRDGEWSYLGPFAGLTAGPADAGPHLRICGDEIAFLAAQLDPPAVVAITDSDQPDQVNFLELMAGTDAARFAAARQCP